MYSVENCGIDFLIRNGVNNIEGLNGKIKCLYEDFHVHEITNDNKVVHLTQLIDKKKIELVLFENQKKEQEKIIKSLNNVDLHFLSNYLNETNQTIFKRFIQMLHEIYKLKEEDILLNDNLKNVSIPYCYLLEVDIVEESQKSSNENNVEKTEQYDTIKKSERKQNNNDINVKKHKRKEIHNLIKNCFPFLISETQNLEEDGQVLSHGNLFKDSSDIEKKYKQLACQINQKWGKVNTGIVIYPSVICLKVILPRRLFKKLERKCKKCRFTNASELENIDLNKIDKLYYSFTNSNSLSTVNKLKEENKEILNSVELVENITHIEKKRKLTNGYIVSINNHGETKNSNPNISNKNDNGINAKRDMERNEEMVEGENIAEEKIEEKKTAEEKTAEEKAAEEKVAEEKVKSEERVTEEKGKVEETTKTMHNDELLNGKKNENKNFKDNNYCLNIFQHIKREKKKRKREQKYLHFNLYKENKDICEILNKLKMCLKKKLSDISYCGIKDKRGITVQKFCISKTKKEDLLQLILKNEKWFNNIFISNIEYKRNKLILGNLKGNFFKILIRGVDNDAYQKCQVLCENLKKHGFVNYFGEQRFGNRRIKNYEIGMKILKKQYKEAILLCIPNTEIDEEKKTIIFNYINAITEEEEEEEHDSIQYTCNNRKLERGKRKENKQKINSRKRKEEDTIEEEHIEDTNQKNKNNDLSDFERVVKSIPKRLYVERVILNALTSCKNFKNAFMKIPKDIFSLFIHSAQSLVFNILANLRMKKFGMKVVVGDLIQEKENEKVEEEEETEDGSEAGWDEEKNNNDCEWNRTYESEFSSTYIKKLSDAPININGKEKKCKNGSIEKYEKKNIVVVTEENLHKFDIYDVVLPLPGDQNIIYPPNLIEEYKDVLNHFNLTFEDFKSNKNFFNVSGCFRKLVVKPYNVKLIFLPNEQRKLSEIPMLKSDLLKLRRDGIEEYKETKETEVINESKKTETIITTSSFVNTPEELREIEENIIFIPNDQHHEHLIKTVPNYQCTSSIFLTCSLPKSSYITIALKEVLSNT